MRRHSALHTWKRLLLSLTAVPVLLFVIISVGCNKKATDGGDEPIVVPWRLEFRAPAVMYRDRTTGLVPNDTIAVRLYNTSGAIQGGVTVYLQALKSPQRVSPYVNTVADTMTKPWGSDQPVFYWGAGDPDPSQPEVISAQAVVAGDTIARGEARFLVHDGIQLMILGADTLWRGADGHVDHAPFKVRLYDSTNVLMNDIQVHCQCLISAGSVTPLVRSRADTSLFPSGSVPTIQYWGTGDPTEPDRFEMITCWAAVGVDTAYAQKSFRVLTP